MDAGSLPVWAQNAGILGIALVSAILGVFKYLKTEAKTDAKGAVSSAASVISASFIDSKLLKELIEALREGQDTRERDDKKTHRLFQDLRESINELNESVIVQTDSTMNLVRFVNRKQARTSEDKDSHDSE